MAALDQRAAAEKQKSINDSRGGNVGAPGDPGTQPNYNDPKKFAGDDEGMLKSTFEPQFAGDDGYEDQGMSRQDPKYFGLGKDDGTGRKIKKANKTAGQIVKMQNKRSSVKNVYLGDPDDLEGEMVRTADKPASKREVRKIKKFKKTKNQLGEKAVSPFNKLTGPEELKKEEPGAILKVNTPKAREPRKKASAATVGTVGKSTGVVNKRIEPKTEKVVIKKKITGTPDGKTAKDRGKVDKSGREGNNRQERKKRRAERKSIRKDKTLSSSQKKMAKKESRQKQKENTRGIKKKSSPLNMHEGKKHAESSYQPIKDKNGKVILTSEQARNVDEDFPKEKKDLKPTAADIKKAKIANDKMKALKAKAKAAKAAKATKKITKS